MKTKSNPGFRSYPSKETTVIATNEKLRSTPRLILAHPNPAFVAVAARHLGQLGWEVHVAATAGQVRALAQEFAPSVVVMSTDLPDESGWLLCAKLRHEHPRQRVILVGTRRSRDGRRFTEFVGGSALVYEAEGVQALADAVQGNGLRAVG
jgi:CheY-like chemotaxis protein